MPGNPGPTVRRRQLGSALRRYRGEAGLSVREVAELMLCSPTKISRIETAQRNATLRDVRDLCNIYAISDEAVRNSLMELARESRERAWWQSSDLDPALETLIGLEGSATTISEFETSTIPGLLQTTDYAHAILTNWHLEDPVHAQQAVDLRMKRQEILNVAERPILNVVLDEAAVRRVVGNPVVMRAQLEHLAALGESPSTHLQIIPFSAGAHVGMNSGFILLEFTSAIARFAEPVIPSVVYVEGISGELYLDQPADVEEYVKAFERLRAQALPERETVVLLKTISGQL